jgi:hypothetical protein
MDDVSEIDDVRARLAELPAEAWTPAAPAAEPPTEEPSEEAELEREAEPEAEAEAKAEIEPEAEPEPEPEREPEPAAIREQPAKRRRSRLPLLLILLVAAVAAGVIALASGGSDEKKAPAEPSSQAAGKPAKASGPRVALTTLPGGPSGTSGTAALASGGKRLLVDVKGLPDPQGGAYQVWLYNSVIDAVSLVKVPSTSIKLDLRLPAKAHRYQAVDISLEPNDGNPNHSGQSVVRVPLSKLTP